MRPDRGKNQGETTVAGARGGSGAGESTARADHAKNGNGLRADHGKRVRDQIQRRPMGALGKQLHRCEKGEGKGAPRDRAPCPAGGRPW